MFWLGIFVGLCVAVAIFLGNYIHFARKVRW